MDNPSVNYEEIIERQLKSIADLEREVIELKKQLGEKGIPEGGSLASPVEEELREQIASLTLERDYAQDRYQEVINSKSWKATQGLRDFVWKTKNKENTK